MRYRYRKISVILLLCMLLLNGCGSNSSKNNKNDTKKNEFITSMNEENTSKDKYSTQDENEKIESTDDETVNGIDKQGSIEPPAMVDVPIYTIDTDDMLTISTDARVEETTKIDANLIVQLVISMITDQAITVDVNEVTMDNSYVVIDFSSKTAPIADTDGEVESLILDAFAFSIIDNVSECKGVIFRVDGEAYQSENHSFDMDEVYLSR